MVAPMSVADLAHEAAKRYCAALPLREWGDAVLERLAVPAALREPRHVDGLMDRWRRVMEEQLVERFTVGELTALARFYGTPEGVSAARKALAFTAAVTPLLESELVAWACTVAPQPSTVGQGPRDVADL
jgi:hypothetical protein